MPRLLKALTVVLGATAAGGAVAWAASPGGATALGAPVVILACALAFVAQWIAFIPAYLKQTEHFYDLTGALTYLGVTAFALALTPGAMGDPRALVLAACVGVWASRLGVFLFRRVRKDGGDGRFDAIKPNPGRFLVAWTLQGLWVFFTLSAALAAITAGVGVPLGWLDGLGLAIWIAGFSIEAIADAQKRAFREAHPKRFIDTGLWAWSRHPNYFGEITLWVGVALIAASTLEGTRWVTALVSPAFVTLLLTRISGIPMLEKRADERWGDDPDYVAYRESTPVLIPRPPSSD